jgi:taurine dioxygenase
MPSATTTLEAVRDPRTARYRTPAGLEVTRLQPAIGAVLSGVDLTAPIPSEAAADIRQALFAHGVIFLQNQKLTYDTHRAFAQVFGELLIEGEAKARPEVLEVRSEGGRKDQSASQWHSDGCYMQVPPAASILRSVVVPTFGGDTARCPIRSSTATWNA